MGAPLEITRQDETSADLRALNNRCVDGVQVRRILTWNGRSSSGAVIPVMPTKPTESEAV